jgi:hypothetical protein
VNRTALYVIVNVLFTLAAMAGAAQHPGVAHPLYVVLLFALCTTPVFEAKAVNGPYSLLVLWSFDYFIMYGALDFRNLLLGKDELFSQNDGLFFTSGEWVIIAGAVLVQVAYRLACRRVSAATPASPPMNWSERTLLLVGIPLWVISSKMCWDFSVHLLVARSNVATSQVFAAMGGVKVAIYMLARMAQPLSIVILAYLQCRYKRPYMIPVLAGVVLFQLLFGFVIDTKSDALIGGVLVVLTNFLVNGRIPKVWGAAMCLLIVVGFPILQANRVVRDERNENPTVASTHIVEGLQRALAATGRTSKGSARTQSALERSTTKSSVEIIVRGTANGHAFQNGRTIAPLITAFIPRLLWSDKPSIATGQILNKEFNISAGADTYISPSHLGDLYWNFGWGGVVVGMSVIGALLGFLAAKFNLAEAGTVTRLLMTLITVRLLIMGSEGEIAVQYVVWMRSIVGIGLLHWLFARTPWSDKPAATVSLQPAHASPLAFPNLLR